MSVDFNDLRNLSVAEKLRIVELLWDDIATSNEPIELQPWQFEKATIRARQIQADPSMTIDRDELWRRVNG